MQQLSVKELSNMFGCSSFDLSEDLVNYFICNKLDYLEINSEQHNEFVQLIHKELEKKLIVSGQHRYCDWEQGWTENLESFKSSRYSLETLKPKYYHTQRPLRLKHTFIKPLTEQFEWHFSMLYRKYLFAKYFVDISNIYEFGCGSCHNLALLAEMYPNKYLFGFDWANSSVEILDLLKYKKSYNIQGAQFDFYSPNESIAFNNTSAVLTYHALEQVGKDFKPFIDFLMKKKPTLIVNVECLLELYDSENPLDLLAIKYHKKRNYLAGLIDYLRKLEKNGEIKILELHRTKFGSFYHEGYSHIVWKINI